MSDSDRLLGLRAIVTGANDGIGEAITRLFAQHQAQVCAVDLPDSGIDSSFAALPGVTGLGIDLREADGAAEIVKLATETMDGIDIVVNNAAVFHRGAIASLSDEDWQDSLDVNVTAMFRLCRAALSALKLSPAGRVINIGSLMSAFAVPELAAYVASKHAVAGLTKTLASEWGKFGITANYLLPGAIMTGETHNWFREHTDERDYWINKSAAKRLGEPLDVARVALFLASDDSVFVSGQGLVVDGGAAQAL